MRSAATAILVEHTLAFHGSRIVDVKSLIAASRVKGCGFVAIARSVIFQIPMKFQRQAEKIMNSRVLNVIS